MRKILIISLCIIAICVLSACTSEENLVLREKVRSVEVYKAENVERDVTLSYVGTVNSKEIVEYSFKSAGKILAYHVKEGQEVRKGDLLVELDQQELKFQLENAELSLRNAEIASSKAIESAVYDNDYFNNMASLYEAGALSKDVYDQVKLKAETSNQSLQQAKYQENQAKVDYDYKSYLLEHSKLYAQSDGYVVVHLADANEQVGAYTPVISVRSDIQIVSVGIAQPDLQDIKEGTKAKVDISGILTEGEITLISQAPDRITRTYSAEIELKDSVFRIGSIGKVELEVGKEEGIWVPTQSVLSDGESYVFVVEDERVFKKIVDVIRIDDGYLQVRGLAVGDLVVSSGMKNVSDGYKVSITK